MRSTKAKAAQTQRQTVKSVSKGKSSSVDSKPKKGAFARAGWNLYRSADYNSRQRQPFVPLPRDAKYDINGFAHLRLMALARFLVANVPFVRGAVAEIANYSVGDGWLPIFQGKDPEWGHLAQEWLINWFRICDVRGKDMTTVLRQAVHAAVVDGDQLWVLTEFAGNYPAIQAIPSHRVATRDEDEYNGMTLLNGVIVNDISRPVGYLVTGNSPDGGDDTFISTKDCQLISAEDWVDQVRGLTAFASAINSHVDIDDINECLKMTAKILSAISLVENVEGGQGDEDDFLDETNAEGKTTTVEEFYGGMIRKFRAGSGAKVEAFEHNQPSVNLLNFLLRLTRETFCALNWPMELSYDPTGMRGANNRVVLAKADRTVKFWQSIVGKGMYRAVGYAISKAMKLGLLPWNDEWYKWDFTCPSKLTADEGKDGENDRANLAAGTTTLSAICGKLGANWKDVQDQWLNELEYTLAGATDETKRPKLSALLKQLGPQIIISSRLGLANPPAKPKSDQVEAPPTEPEEKAPGGAAPHGDRGSNTENEE